MRTGLAESALYSRLLPDLSVRNSLALAALGACDSLWMPDHLVGLFPQSLWTPERSAGAKLIPLADAYYDAWTLLGYVAAKNRWRRLRLGTGVTDAGRRHPAVTAQAAASLHQLTRGRAILGIGPGERENNEPFGVDWSKPVGRFEEAVATIRALWDSDGTPISRDSDYYPLRDAVFAVPRHRGTRPPIWIAAHGPRMLRAAGRYGDGWLPAYAQVPDEYAESLTRIKDSAATAGRDPERFTAAKWFFVVTAGSDEVVEEVLDTPLLRAFALCVPATHWARHGVEHPLGPTFSGAQDVLPQLLDEETALALGKRAPMSMLREQILSGTPDEVVDKVAQWRDAGVRYAVFANLTPFHPKLLAGMGAGRALVSVLRRVRKLGTD